MRSTFLHIEHPLLVKVLGLFCIKSPTEGCIRVLLVISTVGVNKTCKQIGKQHLLYTNKYYKSVAIKK